MTNPEAPDAPQPSHWKAWSRSNDVDVKLRALARSVDPDASHGVDVTLILPGGLLSGLLVHQDTWAAAVLNHLRSGSANASVDALAPLLDASAHGEEFGPDEIGVDRLHLVEARLVSGGVTVDPAPWRVRIKDVSGWTFGRYA